MTDLGTQLRAYGEQIDSERSPVGLLEATRPDIPLVSQSRGSRATEPSPRRRIAAAAALVATVGLVAWVLSSTAGRQDPMLPPAATTSLPAPANRILDEPSTTTSGDDATGDQEGAVDEATLDMLHSYVEMRWSGDLEVAMAPVADPDLLSDSDVRVGRFSFEDYADPWFSWLFYTPAEQFPGHIVPNQMTETGDFADRRRDLLRRARAAMMGPLTFELKLGTQLIAMDCEELQTPGTVIRCLAEATNQLHPADSEPFTHIFEFLLVEGRIVAVGSTSYTWAPAEVFTEVDDTLRDAWRSACRVVFEEGTGFVPAYPDDTVEAWTELASSCAEFALERFAVADQP